MKGDPVNNLPSSTHSILGGYTLPTQSHAYSNTPATHSYRKPEKYQAQGLLPDATMAQLANAPYDPKWMINNGVDESVLNSFYSRFKLEALFGRGLFLVGDIFRTVTPWGSIQTEVEATVSEIAFTPSYIDSAQVVAISTSLVNGHPDFQIVNKITGATTFLHKCKGVSELFGAMSNKSFTGVTTYRVFQISRNGQDLGNLTNLRAALEVYIEEIDLWSRKSFGAGRRRRGPKKPKENPAGAEAMRLNRVYPDAGLLSV